MSLQLIIGSTGFILEQLNIASAYELSSDDDDGVSGLAFVLATFALTFAIFLTSFLKFIQIKISLD